MAEESGVFAIGRLARKTPVEIRAMTHGTWEDTDDAAVFDGARAALVRCRDVSPVPPEAMSFAITIAEDGRVTGISLDEADEPRKQCIVAVLGGLRFLAAPVSDRSVTGSIIFGPDHFVPSPRLKFLDLADEDPLLQVMSAFGDWSIDAALKQCAASAPPTVLDFSIEVDSTGRALIARVTPEVGLADAIDVACMVSAFEAIRFGCPGQSEPYKLEAKLCVTPVQSASD